MSHKIKRKQKGEEELRHPQNQHMNRKKVVKAIALCSVIGALAVGGTSAYLTDYGKTTNTFTVGKVDIDLKEPNWNPEDHTKIVATEEMKKDPQITNVGKNDAYVYMEVSVPVKNVITANADGSRKEAGATELFSWNKSASWTLMGSKTVGTNKVYLYNYNKVVKPTETTEALFKTITFANVVEGQVDEQQLDVDVRAYAIQDLNTDNKEETVDAQAKTAWEKYTNQNKTLDGATLVGNLGA